MHACRKHTNHLICGGLCHRPFGAILKSRRRLWLSMRCRSLEAYLVFGMALKLRLKLIALRRSFTVDVGADANTGVPLEAGQRRDRRRLPRASRPARVVILSVAQEKMRAFKAQKRCGPGKAVSFDFSRQSVAVNQHYFYVHDREWGPAFLEVGTYLPYPVKLCLNGHEWVKQRLRRDRIRFESLDNGLHPDQSWTQSCVPLEQTLSADLPARVERPAARERPLAPATPHGS